MAAKQLMLPANRAFNSNGLAVPYAVAKLYTTGTLTPQNFYADEALTISLGSSITANGAGRFPTAYGDANTPFRLRVEDKSGVELDDIDPNYFGGVYGAKGDPGGNVMSLGTFALAPSTTVPVGTNLVQLSGTSTAGDAGAGRQFVAATEVTTAFVTANPLISFIDNNGRGFREIDPRTGTKIVPYVLVITGQSNAAGAYNDGPNPASPGVQTWNGATSAWGSSDITQAPWTLGNPHGNSGCNNFALAAAHRIYADTRRPVYIIFHATGGMAISNWISSGVTSLMFAGLKTKIENALATSQLSTHSISKIDGLIWSQGEEDGTRSFTAYKSDLVTLDAQFHAQTWFDQFTRVCVTGMADLHDHYEIAPALKYYCSKAGTNWLYISTKGMPATNSHFIGKSLWEVGYNRIAARLIEDATFTPENEPPTFYGLGSGPFTPADNIPAAIFTGSSLISWESRTDGPQVTDTFTGDGSTTAFTLTSRGTVLSVTVNGSTLVAGTDYTLPAVGANPYNLMFTTAPALSAAIVVSYNAAINGPASLGAISFGYRCYADANYSFAGGKLCVTTQNAAYTILYGNNNFANDTGQYGAGFGRDHYLQNSYQLAAGRGHTLIDTGTSALGVFSKYTTTQTDPVLLQIGNGTNAATRGNAWAVRKSGVTEQATTVVASLPAAGTAGRRAFVTDANAATFGTTVAAGGTNKVPVFDNGTNWVIG